MLGFIGSYTEAYMHFQRFLLFLESTLFINVDLTKTKFIHFSRNIYFFGYFIKGKFIKNKLYRNLYKTSRLHFKIPIEKIIRYYIDCNIFKILKSKNNYAKCVAKQHAK